MLSIAKSWHVHVFNRDPAIDSLETALYYDLGISLRESRFKKEGTSGGKIFTFRLF